MIYLIYDKCTMQLVNIGCILLLENAYNKIYKNILISQYFLTILNMYMCVCVFVCMYSELFILHNSIFIIFISLLNTAAHPHR